MRVIKSPLLAGALVLCMESVACRDSTGKPTEQRTPSPPASSSAEPHPATGAAAQPGRRGPRVYVSNEDSNNISVIDSATDEVTGTIFVGKRPRGIRLSPDGKMLFVALSGSPKDPPGARADAARPLADRAADGVALVDVATEKLVRTIPSG